MKFLRHVPGTQYQPLFSAGKTRLVTVTLKNGKHSSVSKKFPASIFVDKQPEVQWLDMAAAIKHCQAGIDIWGWACNDANSEPDIIMVYAGDVPTLGSLAAVKILREQLPQLQVRVINVVNLMIQQPKQEHPSELTDQDFDTLFTKDKNVVFAFPGYPWLIHRLTYRRKNHHALRYDSTQRSGPLSPGQRCHRPGR